MSSVNPLSQVKKCVTFVFFRNQKGEIYANGTGFFVGVNAENNPAVFHPYFVTAKHVLQQKDGNFFDSIILRLNTLDGASRLIEIKSESMNIFTHSDSEVDISVFPCGPDQSIFDFLFIPADLIATHEVIKQYEISEGEDMFFSGLFTSHIGQKRNQPILRFGRMALMSDEKIEWKEKGKNPRLLELYLMECQSFGGNSGSPVFFYLSPTRKDHFQGTLTIGRLQIYLAGIMMGTFLSANELSIVDAQSRSFLLRMLG